MCGSYSGVKKRAKNIPQPFFFRFFWFLFFGSGEKLGSCTNDFILEVERYVVGFEICFFFQEKFISELLETTSLFKFHEKRVNRS